MRLLEYQAKQLFSEHGMRVPQGKLITCADDFDGCFYPAVLKIQVPVGGRGKAGGIKIAADSSAALILYPSLLATEVKGYYAQTLFAEETIEIKREIYLALLYDRGKNTPMIMASGIGGMDIEQVAREEPDRIIQIHYDLFLGIQPYMVRRLGKFLSITDLKDLDQVLQGMYAVFTDCHATLVEINPLAETPAGLVALDAKVELDDKAEANQAERYQRLRDEQHYKSSKAMTAAEEMAAENHVKYVLLDGDVGIITDGAGTGMLTLDLVQDEGGKPADFCELGGLANPDLMHKAINVVLANTNVKALLISLIGGLTRMDEMAEGIAMYLRENKNPVPIVVRMCGTQEEDGREILRGVGLTPFYDITDAVREAVSLAQMSK
jgi:succinyl-CoA synthetase beta subunit